MRRTLIPLLAAMVVLPAVVRAQDWSAEQKAVWDREVSCVQNRTIAGFESCFHEDFVGWGSNSTVPTTKADRRPFFERSFATEDLVFSNVKPLNITVRGDMAVILYIATFTTKNKTTGEETTTTERWTDIMLRDGGRWAWIADHGMVLKDDGR